jgi:hypothetical protein
VYMRRLVYIVFAIPIVAYFALVIYAGFLGARESMVQQYGGSVRSKCYSCEAQDPFRDYPQSCYSCEYQERAMYALNNPFAPQRFSPSSRSPIFEITQGE